MTFTSTVLEFSIVYQRIRYLLCLYLEVYKVYREYRAILIQFF